MMKNWLVFIDSWVLFFIFHLFIYLFVYSIVEEGVNLNFRSLTSKLKKSETKL